MRVVEVPDLQIWLGAFVLDPSLQLVMSKFGMFLLCLYDTPRYQHCHDRVQWFQVFYHGTNSN
jgi:hypothetical protein